MAHGFRKLAIAAVLAAGTTGAGIVGASSTAATEQLAEQARFWEQRNRPEMATESWQRLLSADPGNEEALARLAVLATASGDTDAANRYTARLRAINPNSPYMRDIETGRAVARIDTGALARARALAAENQTAEALAAYRAAFDGDPPSDAYALEYYQVMAADDAQHDRALAGMKRLAAANPANPTYALAVARQQTYRQRTRREGIASLRRLHDTPAVRRDAAAAWRQALIWLEATPADESLFQQYLAVDPDDAEITAARNRLRAQRPDSPQRQRDAAVERAFDRFNAGELTAAEAGFEDVLRGSPRNADALGGLGLVRLRQERYAESDALLQRAMDAQPASAARWREAKRSAAFFARFQTAEAAREDGDLPRALSAYRAAFAEEPAGLDPVLRISWASALMDSGDLEAAERELRRALAARPDHPDALRALAQLLVRTGRTAEAEQIAARGPAEVQAAIAPARADALRQRAAESEARGDRAAAKRDLREAIALSPNNPWVRLDLARILRAEGDGLEADALLDGLRLTHPDLPEVAMAQAFALADAERWLDVLYELEQMPQRNRTRDARTLQRQAWINYQVQRAGIAAERDDLETAYGAMAAADRAAGDDAEFLSTLAGGWAGLGDPARALSYMRRSFEGRPASIDQRLQYAGLLLELGQDAEFEGTADLLLRQRLTPDQGRSLEGLIVGYRIKLADQARERGDLASAYAMLREVVQRRPQEARVQMALARIFDAAGDHAQAMAIYDGILQREPDNLDVIYGAANAALGSGDIPLAEQRVNAARRAAPDAPEADEFAARLAELRGNSGLALRHYEQAARKRQRMQPQAQVARAPQLQLLSGDEAYAPLLPRPVAEHAMAWDAPLPQRAMRPRPSSFDSPVPPSVGPDPFGPSATIGGLRMTPETSSRRPDPTQRSAPAASSAPAVRLRADERLGPAPNTQRQTGASTARSREPRAAAPATTPTPATSTALARGGASAATPSDSETLTRLRAQTSGWTGGAMHSRVRDGESGLSRLINIEVPIEVRSTATPSGSFGLRLVPVYADAGNVSGQQLLRFGTLSLINGGETSRSQSESGLAIGLGYHVGSFSADIGTTPLGFEEERVTGGLRWAPNAGPWRMAFDLSRRPIADSLLSYSGVRDPLTGVAWGGINRSRARADIAYDLGNFGVYGNLGFAYYDGRNTDDNSAGELGGGAYVRAWQTGSSVLTYGVNVTTFFYDKNRRYFSFGHGGYFSPQFFLGLAVPVELSGTWGALTYRVNAAIGLQTFREDGAALFPNNPNLQAELEDIILADPDTDLVAGYADNRQSGLGYALGGALEYQLAPRLFLGGTLGTDNARDFTEFHFSGFLRYYFNNQPFMPDAPRPLPAHFNFGG
jgi:tetratricopeptide (TPR) repeat protein